MEIVEFHGTRDFFASVANLTLPWALRRLLHLLLLLGSL